MQLDVLGMDQLSRVSGGQTDEPGLCKGPNAAAEMVKQGKPGVDPNSLALGKAYRCKGVESLTPEQLNANGVTDELVKKMRLLPLAAL